MNNPGDAEPEQGSLEEMDVDATTPISPTIPSTTPLTTPENAPDATTEFGSDSGESSKSPVASGRRSTRDLNRIVGGYRLTELLGEGGMGRVFKAVDSEGRPIALKLLSPKWATSEDALKRFKQEGYIASQINHPHCVFVHRVDEDQGTPFIAMELMSGQTLKDLVAQDGPLPFRRSVELILQCIEGLIETHNHGMVHRDVKPANCYLDEHGQIKIGDFGLARSLVTESDLTQTGSFLGTPLYASPEQIMGEEVDAQSDIYSLSATLFFLLSGRAPFESPNAAQVIAKIASADPPTFQELGIDVPKVLERIVLKGLSRDRSKRYATLEAMRHDLIEVIAPPAEVASLPKRIVAGLIDSFVVSSLTGFLILMVIGQEILANDHHLAVSSFGVLVSFLYFFSQEAIYGSTPGKRFLRLHVVHSKTGRRAAIGNLAARSLSFVALWSGIELIFGLWYWNPHPLIHSFVSLFGQVMGLVTILAGLWISKGRQLMFEWLSRTETRMIPYRKSSRVSKFALPAWQLPTRANDLGCESLGPFELRGRIETAGESAWYLAEDSGLQRSVWIHLQPEQAVPLSEERKKSFRQTRLRFLQTGVWRERRWEAFLAPNGIPFQAITSQGFVLPWPISKRVLMQVCNEYSVEDRTRITQDGWQSNALWVDETGRIVFSEMKLTSGQEEQPQDFAKLLSEIASAGLPQKDPRRLQSKARMNRTSIRPNVEDLCPLRGLQLLEQIADGTKAGSNFREIKELLRTADDVPNSVSSAMRFSHAAGTLLALSPWLAILIGLMMANAVILYKDLRSECRKLLTMKQVMSDEVLAKSVFEDLEPELRKLWMSPDSLDAVGREAERRFEQAKQLYGTMSSFERMVFQQASTGDTGHDEYPEPESVAAILDPNRSSKNSKNRAREVVSIGIGAEKQEVLFDESDSVDSLRRNCYPSLRFLTDPTSTRTIQPRVAIFWITFYSMMGLVVWSAIFRGGILQYFTGVSFMRRDGCRAGRLRCAWRMFLLLLPFLILVGVIQLLSNQVVDGYWWIQHLRKLIIILPILYLTATFIWPQASIHDWLSDTAVVPR